MQFMVHGHHLDLTDALKERCRQHVLDRAAKLVDDSAARLEIVLADQYGSRHGKADKACSISLRAPGMPPINVTEVRHNMYEAIDLAADRLIEAMRRAIQKREKLHRRDSIKGLEPVAAAETAETLSAE